MVKIPSKIIFVKSCFLFNVHFARNKPKKKVWPKVLLIIVIILAIAGGVFAYNVHKNGGGAKGVLTTVLDTKKDVGEFQCLILGISTDEKGSLLTDTIMVASYNPKTQKAALISVPRDSYTGKNPAKATAYEKINSLYSRKEDPQTVLDAVNNLTGLNIQYYAIVKTESEANQLNDYIKTGYYNEVPEANFEKWTDVVAIDGGFAVEIMDFMQYRPVPDFIVNGIEFVNEIDKPAIEDNLI